MATERPLEWAGVSEVAANNTSPPDRTHFDPALTVEQVAEKLKVSQATVYSLLKAGTLTSYKVGRSWRIDELDLVHYIKRQKARNGAGLSGIQEKREQE